MPEHTDVDLNSEFNHIKQWAATNGLIINSNKPKKLYLDNLEFHVFISLLQLMILNRLTVVNCLV